jgi:hypothetical protein
MTGPRTDFDSTQKQRWKARWTAAIVILTLLSFATGMAATGIAHQAGWLVTETDPFVNESGSARAIARSAASTNNLKQIGLAASEIEERDGALPPGMTITPDGEVLHGWMTFLLPFIEKQTLFDEIDLKLPWDHPRNIGAFKQDVDPFQNPGITAKEQIHDAARLSLTSYAGNIHVLGGTRRLTFAEITDGTANTILAGEIALGLPPWGKPGNWRDPAKGINRSPRGFGATWGSQGRPGANILLLDGSVRFIKSTVDPRVLESLGTPRGGEVVSSDTY